MSRKIAPLQIKQRLFYVTSIDDIPWTALYALGARVAAFDIENTLARLLRGHKKRLLSREILLLLVQINALGFKIALATNSTSYFESMVNQLVMEGVPGEHILLMQPRKASGKWWQIWKRLLRKRPRKPQLTYFNELRLRLRVEANQVVMVGDKLNFDVLPALRAGYLRAYWIHPSGPDLPLEFARRWREKLTAWRYGLPQIERDYPDAE